MAVQVAPPKYWTWNTAVSSSYVFLCLAASGLSLQTYASLPGQSISLPSVCVKDKHVFFAPSTPLYFTSFSFLFTLSQNNYSSKVNNRWGLEIPDFSPRVQHPVYKDPSLSQSNPVITFAHSFFSISFNVIFPSNPWLLKQFLVRLPIKMHFALSAPCVLKVHDCHITGEEYVLWRLLLCNFLVLCYVRCLMPKYFPHYLIVKHHHSKFLPPVNYCKVISKCKFGKINPLPANVENMVSSE